MGFEYDRSQAAIDRSVAVPCVKCGAQTGTLCFATNQEEFELMLYMREQSSAPIPYAHMVRLKAADAAKGQHESV